MHLKLVKNYTGQWSHMLVSKNELSSLHISLY